MSTSDLTTTAPTTITIDRSSGFCFGVVTAIHKAEEQLEQSGELYCLGDIVHNSAEVDRLQRRGLTTISHDDLKSLRGKRVLLRAHGEPPSTYATARENAIEIIDATCPVVLKLQRRIKEAYEASLAISPESAPQIVIYGKLGHAEVNGLVGQTAGRAIVIEGPEGIDKIDRRRNVLLYSQTTKSREGFHELTEKVREWLDSGYTVEAFDTICGQVSNRVKLLQNFAGANNLVLFVSGAKSSNGRVLYAQCRSVNPQSYLVANDTEVDPAWFDAPLASIGICGATSTPRWLMEQVRTRVASILSAKGVDVTLAD